MIKMMKISDIILFIKKIKDVLQLLGFTVENKENCYLASYGQLKALIIPHFENIEFELPKEQLEAKKVIITASNFNSYELKVLSLNELEYLAKNKEKLGETYDKMINVLFFDNNFTSLIDFIIDEKGLNEKAKNEPKSAINEQNEEKTTTNKIDISIVEKALSIKLENKKKYYANSDYAVIAITSKLHPGGTYWYGYHDYQMAILKTFNNAYMAFYFRDRKTTVLLLPVSFMENYRSQLSSTTNDYGTYWHIHLNFENEKCFWQLPHNVFLNVTEYLINKTDDEKF